jgi:hypothetical protein
MPQSEPETPILLAGISLLAGHEGREARGSQLPVLIRYGMTSL